MRITWLVLFLAAFVPVAVAQQPGTLDLSFDADGKHILSDFDSIGSPVIVPTADLGLIIAFQQTLNGISATRMVRLLEDGTVHPGFGINGVVTTTTLGAFTDLAMQSDGKTVLLGQITNALDSGMVVERFTEAGVVDSTYGINGRAVVSGTTGLPTMGTKGSTMLPDDRLLLHLGDRVVRLSINGSIDMSFGTQGVLLVSTGVGEVALTPTGRLRWSKMGLGLPNDADYNGQEPIMTYPLSGGPVGSQDQVVYGPFVVNHHDQSVGHCQGIPTSAPGVTVVQGFGKVSVHSYPSAGETYYGGTLYWLWAIGGGNFANPDVGGTLGPVAVDQAGNFLMAYHFNYYSYTGPNTGGQWVDVPVASVWKVKRAQSGFSSSFDPSFGTPSGLMPSFEIGNDASFSNSIPVPNSMTVQVDGKVVVAGTCLVNGVNRIVLARYHNIPDPRSMLSLRMFLGGAYDPGAGLMRDDLREQGLVPTLQPYGPPFFSMANGVGTWAAPQSVLQVEGDSAVVDWVWLDLLDAADTATVRATRVGLVHRNGWVTSADGRSPIDFSAGAGSYFVRARHRNHLGATASVPVSLGTWQTTLDLTDPAAPTFGTEAQKVVNGVAMLWPGEVRADGVVKFLGTRNDRDPILLAVGGNTPTNVVTGYRSEDLNLDGWVKYIGTANDRDIILQTIGGGSLRVCACSKVLDAQHPCV